MPGAAITTTLRIPCLIFAGMPTDQLQAALPAAQAGCITLLAGGQDVSFAQTVRRDAERDIRRSKPPRNLPRSRAVPADPSLPDGLVPKISRDRVTSTLAPGHGQYLVLRNTVLSSVARKRSDDLDCVAQSKSP